MLTPFAFYSLTEHMIGLIVSSMPSLPTFVKHLRGGTPSTSVSFEPLSQRNFTKKEKSNLPRFTRSSKQVGGGRDGAGMRLDDPSLLYSAGSKHGDARYEELTDLEGQKGLGTRRERLETGHG